MWLSSLRSNGSLLWAFLMFLLGTVMVPPAGAAMSPPEITVACNSLARMAFDLKDLVNVVALRRNPGPFQVTSDPEMSRCLRRCSDEVVASGYPRRVYRHL